MEPGIVSYLIVCPLVFLASFVDAIAGGGGLISLPAYLLAGSSRTQCHCHQQTVLSGRYGYLHSPLLQKQVCGCGACGSFFSRGAFGVLHGGESGSYYKR